MRTSLCFALAFGFLLPSLALSATVDLGNGFADHGVASPHSESRGTVATVGAEGHPVILCWLRDHRGCYELLMIDVQTRKSQEFPLPFPVGDDPYASILSTGNKFYTHFNSHFVEFDPVERAFTFHQKTAPRAAMSMTEDDQGIIWSATYPSCGIASFNPKTREFRDYGHVYAQDWLQYPRSIAVDDSGWVYVGIGYTAAQILAMDPKTGKAAPLVPDGQRRHGGASMYRGIDGKVYAQPDPSQAERWLMLHQGDATPLEKQPAIARKAMIAGSQDLLHRSFPDGKQIKQFDLIERAAVIEDTKTGKVDSIPFDYQSDGAVVMGVAAAPGGTICGGTAFPMRFFGFDPKSDQWTHHVTLWQWNTIARQGDRFFVGAYGGGQLLEWNPSAAWVDTEPGKKESNPLFLAEVTPTIHRPFKLLAHPDGRTLILAGTPAYGLTGGGLLFWDRSTSQQTLLTHEDLIPQHSTMSLAAISDGKLLGGTTIQPGTGGQIKAKQAELYVLDMATKKIDWHEAVLPGVRGYTDLMLGPDGLVWGFADASRFFVFDPTTKKVVHEEKLPADLGSVVSNQGPRAFVVGPSQTVYALFSRGVARIEPKDWTITLLAKSPSHITAGGDYWDGRIYFVAGESHLQSFKLPE